MKHKILPTISENYKNLILKRIVVYNHTKFDRIGEKTLVGFLIILLVLTTIVTKAQSPTLSLVPFCTGLTTPIVISNCGDSRLFVGQKNGYIIIVDKTGTKLSVPFLNIDSRVKSTGNEQGLLGLCFHPKYSTNGFFYVNYTDNNGNTVVSRFMRDASNPNLANLASETLILTIAQPFSNHNGGCIQFGPDGFLYIGLGDGGGSADPNGNSQNMQTLLGKMLRIDVNNGLPYTIPTSNPYANSTTVLPEIWAVGLRNPWRWSFDRLKGDLWIGDVGENTWEEVDFQSAGEGGKNYGWRCYEGNHAFNTAGCAAQSTYVSAISEYQHSSTNGCSITGGYVYRGGKYANLFGHYLVTDYCSGVIRDITPNGNGGWNTTNLGTFSTYEYSTLGEDHNGELYIAELGAGRILKIKEAACLPTAFIKGATSRTACSGKTIKLESIYGLGNTYQWQNNAVNISGGTGQNYNASVSGNYKVIITNGSGCSNASNVINITFNSTPSATTTANGPTTFCAGSSVVLSGNPGTGLTYQWRKYGVNIAGATAINYTATKSGTYKLVVTSSNSCTALSAPVFVNVNCKLDLLESSSLSFQCYPNPNHGEFRLKIISPGENQAQVEITDMLYEIVELRYLKLLPGENMFEISLNSVAKGNYFIKITSGDKERTERIIVE